MIAIRPAVMLGIVLDPEHNRRYLFISFQSRRQKRVFFLRGIRQRRCASGRRVVVRHRFGELAHGQIPLFPIDQIVEVRATGRPRNENLTTEIVLYNECGDAAMILRWVRW